MYYAFFGLTHAPFKITPDTDVFFEGGNRGAVLEALLYAISQGEGIVKLTGEVGSGKTMLCRMLQARVPGNVETVYLANPSVSPEEILHAIAFELQLTVAKDAGRLEVMHRLNEYLLERHTQRKQVVLFVEESQSMPLDTLEEVRLLSNLETNQHKLLQIVLFGQPELDDNLRKPRIRQLRERITHSFSLAPLTTRDIHAYLTFRLHAAGYRGPDLFGKRVVEHIARASAGLTRRVNIIADKALLAAFADGTHNISHKHVKAAVRDSEFASMEKARKRPPWEYALAGVAIGGVLGVAAFAAYDAFYSLQPDGPDSAVSASSQTALRDQNLGGGEQPGNATIAGTPVPGGTTSAPSAPREAATAVPAAAIPNSRSPKAAAGSAATTAPAAMEKAGVSAVPTLETADDLLEQRLLATERWLWETEDDRYSIQLLGAPDADLLRSHLNTIAKYLEIEKVFVYRTLANKRPSLTVLYGTFATRAEADRSIELLAEELKANRPYFRTIRGIRAEIARYNS